MMAFDATTLMWLLKAAVLSGGGEIVIKTDISAAECLLMFEGSEDGDTITLTTIRVDDRDAGHA